MIAPDSALASQVMHRTLRVEDGLVQSQVSAVLEASDGHVWFGTFGGVSHWDGLRFETFRPKDGLAGMDVRAFHETLDGAVLVATADGGISRYFHGAFTTIGPEQGLPSATTRGFLRADDGRLHVATGDGLFVFEDESLDLATARHELPGVRVSGFASRREGDFIMSTFSHGVLVYRDGEAEPLFPAEDLPAQIIRAVHEHDDGTVLLSVYHHGVWTWRDGKLAPFAHNDRLDGHDVMAFVGASDGTLYMPTNGGGIGVWQDDRFEMLTTAHGLADDTSWGADEGEGGTLYFGTWDGVSIYQPGRVLTRNLATGLNGETATAIAELSDGTIAIATIEGGVDFFDGERRVRNLGAKDGLEHDRVWSLLVAGDGSLYVGTNAGLNRWAEGRVTTVYRETEAPHGRIYAMHEQADGTLWLATYGGIRVLRDGRPEAIYDEPNAHRTTVYCVTEMRDGDLLFGTAEGLVTVRDGTAILPDPESPLFDEHIWAIHEGSDGAVYLGTNGDGLWIARDGLAEGAPLETLTAADGLSEDTVFGIAEADDGRLYLTTQRGVSIVTFGEGAPAIRRFDSSDGLAGDECNQGACFGDRRGRFWFGTIRGVTCYDPARDLPVMRPPQVYWRRIRLFTEELSLDGFAASPVFGHRENFFRFEFAAAEPRAPHRVRYRHRMSGIDPDWVEGRETAVAYPSLPAASYTLEVMACNEWDVWSEPLSLSFKIRPPFWRTPWFIVLVSLGGAGAVALIVTARMRHLLAYEKLRTKIAADLHDDIGAGLAEISIVGRLLEHKLPEEHREPIRGELEQLGTTSRRLVRSMSDIVWLVHPQRDSLQDLVTRLADSYRGLCESAGIDFRVENLEALADLRLGMERRQHLYLIFKEAVNNALKYSGCRELRLTARVDDGRIVMSLRDDGAGFDGAAATAGNGLRNMRARATSLGGRLEIETAPGRGCRITFTGK